MDGKTLIFKRELNDGQFEILSYVLQSGKTTPTTQREKQWLKASKKKTKQAKKTSSASKRAAGTSPDGQWHAEIPNRNHYIDTWSRVDHPPVYELRRSRDGYLVTELARADTSGLKKYGRKLPERFSCKDRNGKFDIWGIIHTPPHFDPKKKYPVIENIYAGPHGAFVPKSFTAWRRHVSELVEEGFIVVNIDGLGTNYRHHDFWHFSYKNLVDSGFPDRIKWLKEAAKNRPYMDLSRVGIFGGGESNYMRRKRAEFFHRHLDNDQSSLIFNPRGNSE